MDYVIVAFRSRAETVAFSNYLRQNGLPNQIVNTPKEAGVGCGLSVKVSRGYFALVKRAVFNLKLKSFAGFFTISNLGGKTIVKSI